MSVSRRGFLVAASATVAAIAASTRHKADGARLTGEHDASLFQSCQPSGWAPPDHTHSIERGDSSWVTTTYWRQVDEAGDLWVRETRRMSRSKCEQLRRSA